MITINGTTWVAEPIADGMERLWRVDEVIHSEITPFQTLDFARTAHGITLFANGERQSSEQTQEVYHEALTIPPVLLADRVDRCLVIGSSEGVACQMLVACGASRVDHVDIDEQAVRLCASRLPYGYTEKELAAAEGDDGPIHVHYEDGYAFVEAAVAAGRTWDVIIVDLPDETDDGQAQHDRLYSSTFLGLCARALAPGGVISTQAGCPTMWRQTTLRRSWHNFIAAFPTVVYFGSAAHEWAFISGRRDTVDRPHAVMGRRLRTLSYRPVSIDVRTLDAALVPPLEIRGKYPKAWRRRPFGGPSPRS
ncbi:hypothetical protein [Herbidospora sp. NBRC 101105]|uniref:spermidine synthase n=1 Tax=Herbidospora sp. NBRC 101105 TaxID=3032195 RepID=UPI0024A1005A|nr:hypothetical protein [Herbidospora sp. NBRC 101105]GLX98350.1 polyamine aminopropyltransferase [Herbidospora sp. NBRC 101105]